MKKAQLWEQILFLKVKLSGEGKDEKSTAMMGANSFFKSEAQWRRQR